MARKNPQSPTETEGFHMVAGVGLCSPASRGRSGFAMNCTAAALNAPRSSAITTEQGEDGARCRPHQAGAGSGLLRPTRSFYRLSVWMGADGLR